MRFFSSLFSEKSPRYWRINAIRREPAKKKFSFFWGAKIKKTRKKKLPLRSRRSRSPVPPSSTAASKKRPPASDPAKRYPHSHRQAGVPRDVCKVGTSCSFRAPCSQRVEEENQQPSREGGRDGRDGVGWRYLGRVGDVGWLGGWCRLKWHFFLGRQGKARQGKARAALPPLPLFQSHLPPPPASSRQTNQKQAQNNDKKQTYKTNANRRDPFLT